MRPLCRTRPRVNRKPMLDRIKSLLLEGGLKEPPHAAQFPDRDIAMTVLLLEAAEADGDYGSTEHAAIMDLIARKLKLTDAAARQLVALAEARQKQAVELYRFTDRIVRAFSETERIGLVEMLWEVVYADGTLDAYEDNLMRRLGGLLHVSERDRGDARRRVMERLRAK